MKIDGTEDPAHFQILAYSTQHITLIHSPHQKKISNQIYYSKLKEKVGKTSEVAHKAAGESYKVH